MSPQQLAGTLAPEQASGGLRRLLIYLGPATLVSVGYIDPGNWATDLVACDLAEVLGSAVALNLLLGLPLVATCEPSPANRAGAKIPASRSVRPASR